MQWNRRQAGRGEKHKGILFHANMRWYQTGGWLQLCQDADVQAWNLLAIVEFVLDVTVKITVVGSELCASSHQTGADMLRIATCTEFENGVSPLPVGWTRCAPKTGISVHDGTGTCLACTSERMGAL